MRLQNIKIALDLSSASGPPIYLFKTSNAPWLDEQATASRKQNNIHPLLSAKSSNLSARLNFLTPRGVYDVLLEIAGAVMKFLPIREPVQVGESDSYAQWIYRVIQKFF